MRTRHVLALLLIALTGTATVPSAAADVPVLGGDNVLTGSTIQKMTVRLDQRAIYYFDQLTVTGGARMAGFALTQGEKFLVGYRAALCSAPGCDPGRRYLTTSYGKGFVPEAGGTALEPGVYNLFIVADGAPVTVRFLLSGVDGEATFAPADGGGGTITTASNDVGVPGSVRFPVWGAGADVTAGDSTAYWVAAFAHEGLGVAAYLDWFCRYPGGAPTDGPDPYAPGCPGHELEDRQPGSRWCDWSYGGLIPGGGAGGAPTYSLSSCGSELAPGETVGVGHAAAFVAPTPAMHHFVLGLHT